MKFNSKMINQAIWLLLLLANLIVNTYLIGGFTGNDSVGSKVYLAAIFLYFIAPIGIITSLVILILIKSKHIPKKRKLQSFIFIVILYGLSFGSFFI